MKGLSHRLFLPSDCSNVNMSYFLCSLDQPTRQHIISYANHRRFKLAAPKIYINPSSPCNINTHAPKILLNSTYYLLLGIRPPSSCLPLAPYLFALVLSFTLPAGAAIIDVVNNCPYAVWAAAFPGGGKQLNHGDSWQVTLGRPGITKIWGRTGCTFDASGRGHCDTGDFSGVLECQSLGADPRTLAEYQAQPGLDQDTLDISLVNGFNIPMDSSPTNAPKTQTCRSIRRTAHINGQCPPQLKAKGGCNNPCTVFNTAQYCCPQPTSCEPTDFSRFFKQRCPDAFSYPRDDQTGTFTCPSHIDYRVTFCP